MQNKVLITGATGFIGQLLSQKLLEQGYILHILSRKKKSDSHHTRYFTWDIKQNNMPDEAVQDIDYVIHLAGANVAAKRWNKKYKREMIASRVNGLDLILQALRRNNQKIKALVSASAVGIYQSSYEPIDENSKQESSFMGTCCQLWEEKANAYKDIAGRVVILRTGVVLDAKKGALPKLVLPFRLGQKIVPGSGKQYMPWIHKDDMIGLYNFALQHPDLNGVFNAVAPNACTLGELLDAYPAKKLFTIHIPSSLIKCVMGEMSSIIFHSCNASSQRIEKAGYSFAFKNIDEALKNLT